MLLLTKIRRLFIEFWYKWITQYGSIVILKCSILNDIILSKRKKVILLNTDVILDWQGRYIVIKVYKCSGGAKDNGNSPKVKNKLWNAYSMIKVWHSVKYLLTDDTDNAHGDHQQTLWTANAKLRPHDLTQIYWHTSCPFGPPVAMLQSWYQSRTSKTNNLCV